MNSAAVQRTPLCRPDSVRAFHREWKTQPTLSLRGAQRRSNLLPGERTSTRQAGDWFGASALQESARHGRDKPGHDEIGVPPLTFIKSRVGPGPVANAQ
jgi:hypothetical protein